MTHASGTMGPDAVPSQAPLLPGDSEPADGGRPGTANALILSPAGTAIQPELTVNLPAILTDAGEDAVTRFAEYFTAHIRNPHTRRAYFRNAIDFLRWCEKKRGLRELKAIKPIVVATYIELEVRQHVASMPGDLVEVVGFDLASSH